MGVDLFLAVCRCQVARRQFRGYVGLELDIVGFVEPFAQERVRGRSWVVIKLGLRK